MIVAAVAALASSSAPAQTQTTLDFSETIFSVVAAVNVCGYDQALSSSLPLRGEVRAELVAASKSSEVAGAAKKMCTFFDEHRRGGGLPVLAPYISLALNLGAPPTFAPMFSEADIPPDAAYVLGFVPLMKQYTAAADLHAIWLRHEPQYVTLVQQYHDQVAHMITATDNYLRIPSSGYKGRSYTVYLEPMAAPGAINSRNYQGDLYYIVVSPSNGKIHIDELRHTYLHFVLDPLLEKRGTALGRLQPILASVQKAPMDTEYKTDMGLLVIESLIRAIEARAPSDTKLPEKERLAMVNRDEAEGFVLTGYFYEQLKAFEHGSTGLKDAFPDWLHDIDVDRVKKQAGEIQFASMATPDVVQADKKASDSKIEMAEKALASGNPAGAEQLAQEALSANEDPARCYFVLARAASMAGEMQDAKNDFERASASKDPRIAAWSHIYLGRILDIQDERDAAIEQYKAALNVGDVSADTRAAAERGLQAPYAPPDASQQPKSQ